MSNIPKNKTTETTDKKPHSGRRGDPVSLAPLTPDQAMAGLLKVKLDDVKKLEATEGKKKPKKK